MKNKRTTIITILLVATFLLSNSHIYDYAIPKYELEKWYRVFPIMFAAYYVTFSIMFTDDMGHFDKLWKRYPWMKAIRNFILHLCALFLAIVQSIPLIVNKFFNRNDKENILRYIIHQTKYFDSYPIEARSVMPPGVAFCIIASLYECGVISDQGLNKIGELLSFGISLVGLWLVILNVKVKYGEKEI